MDGVEERIRDVVAVWPQIDPLVETIVSRVGRIDTLFETGQLRRVRRELADPGPCLKRDRGPVG